MRIARGIGLIAAVMLLSACTNSGYSILDREPSETDVLPASLDDARPDLVNASSARLSAEHDGVRFFVALPAEGEGVCLAVDAGDDSIIVCSEGQSGSVSAAVPDRFDVRLVPEPARDLDGYEAISDNILIRPTG